MSLNERPSFELWIDQLFDLPVDDLKRHETLGSDYWLDQGALKAEYIAATFENADEHLSRFNDAQLEAGLWFVVSGDYMADALGPGVPFDLRLRLLRSTGDLFRRLFAVRCRELDMGGSLPLYRVCYMFWEIFPLRNAPKRPADAPLSAEKIGVLERILEIENLMCQYSALHGLGHAQRAFPERIAAIIDRWLAGHAESDPRLRNYASYARNGEVQ